jgi:hypothetical protein
MARALAPFEIDEAGRRIDLTVDESHAAWSSLRQNQHPSAGSQ